MIYALIAKPTKPMFTPRSTEKKRKREAPSHELSKILKKNNKGEICRKKCTVCAKNKKEVIQFLNVKCAQINLVTAPNVSVRHITVHLRNPKQNGFLYFLYYFILFF